MPEVLAVEIGILGLGFGVQHLGFRVQGFRI